MRIDDFICLGRTVPEESKKYGAKVCMAGVSQELGSLMRVYPLPVRNPIQARHECVMELERNHQDNRRESWKIRDGFDAEVSIKSVLGNELIRPILKPYVYRSIEQLNDLRLSLGVLEMSAPTGTFEKRNGASHPDQGTLFEIADEVFGANAIDIAPYIQFWDQDGKSHRLQIREWGCYEWIRKQRENAAQLWQNLCLDSPEPTWAIVGNQANRRTSWLIIKTFKVSVVTQLNLFGGE